MASICIFLIVFCSIVHSSIALNNDTSAILWQGRYQYLYAESSKLQFDNGTELIFQGNDTSRSFPPCSGCLKDEIRLPYQDNLVLRLIDFPSATAATNFGGQFPNLDLIQEELGSDKSIRGVIEMITDVVTPSDYDGMVCESIKLQFSEFEFNVKFEPDLTWTATNVIMGNFLDQGYCPQKMWYPCGRDQTCHIDNQGLSCQAKEGNSIVAQSRSDTTDSEPYLDDLCVPIPDPPAPSGKVLESKVDPPGSIQYLLPGGFLQADSYLFQIGDPSSEEAVTNITFPMTFEEVSTANYEIDVDWTEENESPRRRLSMQFEKRFGPILSSQDGWWLNYISAYDTNEEWTSWGVLRDGSNDHIQVPEGYAFFACEHVEFSLQSSYGGLPGRLVFENVLLAGYLEPNYNVCDLNVYHPCEENQICHAYNGTVQCLEKTEEADGPSGIDLPVSIARSNGDSEPQKSVDWLTCVIDEEANRPENDSEDSVESAAYETIVGMMTHLLVLIVPLLWIS